MNSVTSGSVRSYSQNVFSYGTLMVPEVFQSVTCAIPSSEQAILNGYNRYSLIGRVYPAIVLEPKAKVLGKLYLGVDSSSMRALCSFEDSVYEIVKLKAQRMDKNHSIESLSFVLLEEYYEMVSVEPWSLNSFVDDHLDQYLRMCRAWRTEYDLKD